MTTSIGILWALLSIMVAGTCSFSFLQPYWFIHPETQNSFGVFTYCLQQIETLNGLIGACGIYGAEISFSHFPSSSFQAACVLYGGGCILLCTGALLAIMVLCVTQKHEKKIALLAGYLQCMAVVIMLMGLFIYPMGLDANIVGLYCSGAGIYHSGECHVGWGYMLAITGAALSLFCPYLSHYTDFKLKDDQHEPLPVFV